MEIKNRLFTYPVLCEDTDDYYDSSFFVNPQVVKEDANNISIQFDITLENAGIKKLINSDKAEFVIHAECSNTAYRVVAKTQSDVVGITMQKRKVNGAVALLGMVVAKEPIHYYDDASLNEDYDGVDIHFEKGSILAYYNMPRFIVIKNYEELSKSNTIFSVVKNNRSNLREHNPIKFDIEGHKILIHVDDDVFGTFTKIRENESMKPIVNASLVMPALTYMLETLRYKGSDDLEEYQGYAWFQQFVQFYNKTQVDFITDRAKNNSKYITEIVQEMLDSPVSALFGNILNLVEE